MKDPLIAPVFEFLLFYCCYCQPPDLMEGFLFLARVDGYGQLPSMVFMGAVSTFGCFQPSSRFDGCSFFNLDFGNYTKVLRPAQHSLISDGRNSHCNLLRVLMAINENEQTPAPKFEETPGSLF
ncbi:hypothetical protein METBIDRAFT_197388 [Metschnikowia bicuspidata var. bicuspidata NRRL YB-4993]|uniref:Uncharacterized protein n=1 Tax=Metschnikowia bicuspidata var. bicuspidata NRRL YB-4993 TaxID=869754 RepID=A0A1A0H914_9ASCO|nr:hypothetical protein METBIDRAFT_197388 [Metschnikowia bicuspidata var. bicuspidata NRRL YB-4993]OBA20373.1 hypothetical protein METBIDRAFT_197388 [Metschnikowia bicuspidata var. bicuspidata NRRL YB-4993]